MVTIPHDDIADAHGDANSAGTFDLRAADLDGVSVTYVFLDRRSQPGRGHFEVDRTGTQPPPQPAEAADEDRQQRRDSDGNTSYPAFTGKPVPERADAITEHVEARARPRQQPACAMAGHLIVFLIPTGIIPLRQLDVSTRI